MSPDIGETGKNTGLVGIIGLLVGIFGLLVEIIGLLEEL